MASDQELAQHLIAQNIIQESHWHYWLQCREAGDTRSFGVFLTENGYLASDAVSLVNYQLSNTVPVHSELPTQFVAPVPEKMLLSEDGYPLSIGKYRIVGVLGRGGFGVVYEGESEDGAGVAIKVLIDPTVENLPRFQREQRLLALFGLEQGFVPLLETGRFEGGPFFVMPLMTGGSLKERIKKFDYSIDDATELLMTLGRAVALAHREGVVHRDLKPDNILFDSEDRPFISDLGLAKHFSKDGKGAEQSVSLSIAGQGYGTPGYMAPEQMKNAKDVGPETDVFALGSLFFYCLTGRIPFSGQAVFEIAANVIKGQQLALKDFRDDCPPALHAFINRCLAAEPEHRFADGDEFVEELELASAPPTSSHGPLIASLVGAVVLVGAVFVGLQFWIASNEPEDVPKVKDLSKNSSKTELPKDKKPEPSKAAFTPPTRDLKKNFSEGLKNCRMKRFFGSRDMRIAGLVTCCAISPDGRFGVVAGISGLVKVFEFDTGKTLWEKKTTRIDAIAFAQDSRKLYVGARTVLKIWDWVSDVEYPSLKKHTEPIYSVVMSADGRYCASMSKEATYLWDLKSPGQKVLKGPLGGGVARFAPPNLLMMAGTDQVILWNYVEDKIVFGESYDKGLSSVSGAVSQGGRQMLVGHLKMQLSCWSLPEKKLKWRINGLKGPVTRHGWIRSVLISKDESEVISGGGDGQIHFWDMKTGRLNRSLTGHVSWVHGMALHPDGRRLLTVSNDATFRLWDIESEEMIWRFSGHLGAALDLAVSRDGKKLLSGGQDTTARVWDLSTGQQEQSHMDQGRSVFQVAWGKTLSQFVTVGQGVLVYNRDSDQRLTTNLGQEQALQVHFGQDYLYATTQRGQLFRVDPKTMIAEKVPVRLPFSYSITESPGGVFLAVGGRRGGLCLLENSKTEKGSFARKSEAILAHDSTITGLAFLKDDQTLVTSSTDGAIKVWDSKTGVVKRKISGQAGGVFRFAISADERFIISLGATVSVLNLADGALLDTIDFQKFGDAPCSVAASPVKNTFYIGLSSGVILEYEISAGK